MAVKMLRLTLQTIALSLLVTGSIAYAAAKNDTAATTTAYSTSAGALDALPDAPQQESGVPPLPKAQKVQKAAKVNTPEKPGSIRPFSTVGIAVKMGLSGAGFDVAVPLTRTLNLRGGTSFFFFDHTFLSDGTSYDANINLESAMVALDWYPFGGAFRLSPIAQVYNGNSVSATLSVPAGQQFSLGDQDSYSSVSDPVHGTAAFVLGNQGGNKIAPGFTLGFGNMIPRGKGQHWSVPFEAGFVYIQTPQVLLNFQGISCQDQVDASTAIPGPTCTDIATDPTSQQNVQEEQVDINNNLSGLKFFPILTIGLSYKF